MQTAILCLCLHPLHQNKWCDVWCDVNPSSIRDERFLEIASDRWEAEHWLAVIERENREMEKLQIINHTLNKSSQPLLCFHADGSIIACNDHWLGP